MGVSSLRKPSDGRRFCAEPLRICLFNGRCGPRTLLSIAGIRSTFTKNAASLGTGDLVLKDVRLPLAVNMSPAPESNFKQLWQIHGFRPAPFNGGCASLAAFPIGVGFEAYRQQKTSG
jgi:hypothetical protein